MQFRKKPRWSSEAMRGILGRTALSMVLLGVASSLLGYGICSHRIDVMDLAFQKSCILADFFPESWVLRGHAAYYEDLDSRRAGECYRKAVSILPLQVDAWFDLARSEAERGNEREAREVLDLLSPLLSRVSTWKWQEFLLANDMHDEERFASCMNFVFNRLPHRLEEASYLSRQFYGDYASVLPHLEKESYPVFLRQLMRANEVDVALSLWQTMEKDSDAVDSKLKLQFCQFLLGHKKLVMAKRVWKSCVGQDSTAIHDGEFHAEPLNTAFGWRRSACPEAVVERSMEAPYSGSSCLHLHFRGTQNIAFRHLSQIVPVEAGQTYRLRFAEKSRNLTTDQGIFLQVSGYGCSGLNVQSEPVLGTMPWRRSELEVPVPQGCEAVLLQVVRKESLKFDSKLAGDYWLDAVVME